MTLRTYKAYLFRDKDPAIDEFRTLVEDHFGVRVSHKQLQQIEDAGGPAATTMSKWFFGDTLRPQNPTMEAAGRALGYRRRWVKVNGKGK